MRPWATLAFLAWLTAIAGLIALVLYKLAVGLTPL